MTFQIVKRPSGTSTVPSELVNAIASTAGTENAVSVKLDNYQAFTTWQANVRANLRTNHKLRLRTKFNKVTFVVTAWAEQFPEDRNVTEMSDRQLGANDEID